MSCTCVKKEAGKGKGKVKGYIVTELCQECKDQQAIDSANQTKQKEQEDINMMIAQEAQKLAKESLIKDGKIELKDGKLKMKCDKF